LSDDKEDKDYEPDQTSERNIFEAERKKKKKEKQETDEQRQ
jgi:hypothetical protein